MLNRAKRCLTQAPLVWMPLMAACDGQEAPGYYYEVTITGADNACSTDAPESYSETMEYRLERVGTNDVILYVNDTVLGTGVLDGCDLTYRSSLFTDTRDSQTIRWALTGSAEVALGGSGGCASGDGWLGTERIEVSSSTDPAIQPGCVYEMSVEGTYLREVL